MQIFQTNRSDADFSKRQPDDARKVSAVMSVQGTRWPERECKSSVFHRVNNCISRSYLRQWIEFSFVLFSSLRTMRKKCEAQLERSWLRKPACDASTNDVGKLGLAPASYAAWRNGRGSKADPNLSSVPLDRRLRTRAAPSPRESAPLSPERPRTRTLLRNAPGLKS